MIWSTNRVVCQTLFQRMHPPHGNGTYAKSRIKRYISIFILEHCRSIAICIVPSPFETCTNKLSLKKCSSKIHAPSFLALTLSPLAICTGNQRLRPWNRAFAAPKFLKRSHLIRIRTSNSNSPTTARTVSKLR